MATLADLVVALKVDSGQFRGGLSEAERQTAGFADRIAGHIRTAGTVALAGAGAIVAGAGLLASQAVPAASDLNEAMNASSVVFEEAASRVQEFGRQAATVAGLSAAEFNQMGAQVGAMLQNFGLSTEEAADATIDLAVRAADMASIFNTDVSEAMAAIAAGLRGEANPLERFGVSMNQAAVEAQALAMGFTKTNGAFDTAALTQARLALLFEQTNQIAGDFANTSDQLANAARVNQANWQNFLARIGSLGLPIMNTLHRVLASVGERVLPLVEGAINSILPTIENIAAAFETFISRLDAGFGPVQALVAAFLDLNGGNVEAATRFRETLTAIQEFLNKVQEAVQPVIDFIGNNVKLQDVLIAVGLAILSVVIPAIVSAVAAAAPVVAVVLALIAVVALLRTAWENNWGGIQEKTAAVGAFISGQVVPAIQTAIQWVVQAAQNVATWWTGTMLPALQAVWAFLSESVFPLFMAIGNFLSAVFGLAVTVLAGIWQNVLLPALRAVWAFLDANVMPILRRVGDLVEKTVGPQIEAFKQSILDPLRGSFARIKDVIAEVIGFLNTLADRIRNIDLPDWMRPGSPSPWEIALRGVADAMRLLSRTSLPGLETAMTIREPSLPALEAALPAPMGRVAAGGSPLAVTAIVMLDGREIGRGAWRGTKEAAAAEGIVLEARVG